MKQYIERNKNLVIYKHEVRVRYQETDQMGIVYHSNYLIWFEVGRTELLRSLGYNYRQLEEDGVFLPVVSCESFFKCSAKYDDLLVIETKISEISGAKIVFSYNIYNKENSLLLTLGKTVHAFTTKQGKVINIKKLNTKLWSDLNEIIEI